MGILIACLTTGKGTWNQVSEIINSEDWKKTYLITNTFGKENFTHKKELNFITINPNDSPDIIRDTIIAKLHELKNEIGFNDVAINISSGAGHEHAAIISAMMRLGVGIRLVDLKNKKLITL